MADQQALLKEHDAELDILGDSVKRVKGLAGVMRNELSAQNVILDALEEDVEKTDSSMNSMTKKTSVLMEQAQSSDRTLYSVIAFLLCLLGFLLYLVLQ